MANNKENTEKHSNIQDHDKTVFNDMIQTTIKEGGLHICASKGFGKSRLLFSIAQAIRNLENSRVIVFDGSLSWLYSFSKIATFNINEADITLSEVKTIEEIETYTLNNWQLVKLALETHKDLLFRLKTRKPSKRGFFIRTVINYLDQQQRNERANTKDHEATKQISFIIEEAQDSFNSRSTARNDTEEFLTTFNEGRNQRIAFYTASQRLNDFSKTIRTKQQYCLGRINPEDKTPALRQIERETQINLSRLPLRNWLYNGEKFVSPDWKQQGKPHIINRAIREKYNSQQPQPKPKYPSLLKASLIALFGLTDWYKSRHRELYPATQQEESEESNNEDESELDVTMTDGEDDLFPTD
jgi:hypothetical protein